MNVKDKIDKYLNESSEIPKKLRDISGLISKENIDKKVKNKILGYIRDAINLLNKAKPTEKKSYQTWLK
jgi:ribosomal protein S17E